MDPDPVTIRVYLVGAGGNLTLARICFFVHLFGALQIAVSGLDEAVGRDQMAATARLLPPLLRSAQKISLSRHGGFPDACIRGSIRKTGGIEQCEESPR